MTDAEQQAEWEMRITDDGVVGDGHCKFCGMHVPVFETEYSCVHICLRCAKWAVEKLTKEG